MVKQEILKREYIELDKERKLSQKKTVKDLGIWTGEDASFEEHISTLSNQVR